MTIIGMGVDLCEIGRWQAMGRRTPGVVGRLLNPDEAALPAAEQACRFAAKEALAKALGAPAGLAWLDAEVVLRHDGSPAFRLRGSVASCARRLGVERVHLSISHDAGLAVAFVICEGSDESGGVGTAGP